MSSVLNLTNGDSSVSIMQRAKIGGEFLPWRDVLHEGPVPGDLSLKALSELRAKFISGRGWGEQSAVLQGFVERDAKLASFHKFDEVVLWFEHDLYDQLQILQILDWFATQDLKNTTLSIICTNQYLGLLSAEQMLGLQTYKVPITPPMLSLASRAWNAFCNSSPADLCELLNADLSALPYLHNALLRLLEEYPAVDSGLSRTALQALRIIATEPLRAHEIFTQNQSMEEGIFMGDSSFRIVLQELISSDPALLEMSGNTPLDFPKSSEQLLCITDTGIEALNGYKDFLSLSNIDRWIGGVHLRADNDWRWNAAMQQVSLNAT